jgi:hypothetical protein
LAERTTRPNAERVRTGAADNCRCRARGLSAMRSVRHCGANDHHDAGSEASPISTYGAQKNG